MATMLTAETLAELTAASMELPWLDEIRLSQGQVQSVTIIPSDDVSTEEKLMLTFASASRMPQRIPALLQAIAVALGCEQPITAIVHAGGARYTVLQADGRALAIPTKAMSVATYLRVLFLLKDISVTIQALFAVSTSNASE